MATITTRFVVNQAAVDKLLTAPNGPVMQHVVGLGKKVAQAAKADAPRRSGKLAADITSALVGSGRHAVVRVGNTTKLKYPPYIIHGTGHSTGGFIFPKRAKVLRFKIDGRTVFAPKVKGIPPTDYLSPALRRVIASH